METSSNEAEKDTSKVALKQKISGAGGINPKTVERQSRNLIAVLFGVTERDLEEDPALRAYVRYLLTGEDPSPWVILDKSKIEEESI